MVVVRGFSTAEYAAADLVLEIKKDGTYRVVKNRAGLLAPFNAMLVLSSGLTQVKIR